MPHQQTKPKKLSMVQQSIIDARNAPALTSEMQTALDALVSAPMTGGEVNDLTARLKRAILERALNAEMSLHLGWSEAAAVTNVRYRYFVIFILVFLAVIVILTGMEILAAFDSIQVVTGMPVRLAIIGDN